MKNQIYVSGKFSLFFPLTSDDQKPPRPLLFYALWIMNFTFWQIFTSKKKGWKAPICFRRVGQNRPWSCISNHVGINDFLVANFCNLVNFVFQKMKQKTKNLWKLGFFWGSIFEIKIIKLVPSRPRHFLGHHLWQHFVNLLQPTHLG